MKLPRRRFLQFAGAAVAAPAFLRIARAQAYPSRLVRLVVPNAAGGTNDIVGRLMGQWLSDHVPRGQGISLAERLKRDHDGGYWPKAAIIGIRLERQLSEDKLPSLGTAHDGRR